MSGRGRPRKAKSPDSKLTKGRTRPEEVKQASPMRCPAFKEEKQNETMQENHLEEKPSVQRTRKGKATNHFTEETNKQQELPAGSSAAKTCSTNPTSAGETLNTQPDPARSSPKIPKPNKCPRRAKLPEESTKNTMTLPETRKDNTQTSGSRAVTKLSDEKKTQPETPKDIKKASVKIAKAPDSKAKSHLTEDTKTQKELFSDDIKKPMTVEAKKKAAKAKQPSTSEDSTEDRKKQKVNALLKKTLANLRIKTEERSNAAKAVNAIKMHIIKHLRENTECFKDVQEALNTGSYYENLKISHPNEFDVMLPMLVNRVQIEPFGKDGAFYSVSMKRETNPLRKFQRDGILSASEMLKDFREEVKKCVKKFTEWKMDKKKSGCPAVTLITTIQSVTISLDVVLCLKVKSIWPSFTQDGLKIQEWLGAKVRRDHRLEPYYLVPKYEGCGEVQKDGVLAKDAWRVSFSHIEKAILKNHGSDKTCCEKGGASCCRKECLKLLKYLLHLLKEEDTSLNKICSYHAKTTLLHACCSRTKDHDWRAPDLSHCFQLLLQDFENHLKKRELHNFFIPSQNLLSGPSMKTCQKLAERIKKESENGFPIFEPGQHNAH
ncbi:cyclic GMP-AMP synthase [Leuresthes tenuis]|uniref:cyclic GMP-AMP synthase n=1 Tax=Leuresthes tenuis TaxID=355514 RepID=UPI003B50FD73